MAEGGDPPRYRVFVIFQKHAGDRGLVDVFYGAVHEQVNNPRKWAIAQYFRLMDLSGLAQVRIPFCLAPSNALSDQLLGSWIQTDSTGKLTASP